jgi:hypothetical protein
MFEIHGVIEASEIMAIYSKKYRPSAAALGFKFLALKSCCLHGRFGYAVHLKISSM